MNRILLSLLSFTAITTAANAADLTSRAVPAPYAAPAFTWTGFYAGANAGYSFNSNNNINNNANYTSNSSYMIPTYYTLSETYSKFSKKDSFTGGAQIGYNHQIGSIVVGLETDFNYTGVSQKFSYSEKDLSGLVGHYENTSDNVSHTENKTKWFGTVRSRLGFVPADRVMLFVTGGFAYGKVKNKIGANEYINGVWEDGLTQTKSANRKGWTVGAGAEYALTDNVTLKGEYAYVDLGSKSYRYADVTNEDVVTIKDKTSFNVTRVGLNYKF